MPCAVESPRTSQSGPERSSAATFSRCHASAYGPICARTDERRGSATGAARAPRWGGGEEVGDALASVLVLGPVTRRGDGEPLPGAHAATHASGATGATSDPLVDDEDARAELALDLDGNVGAHEPTQESVVVRAEDDETRPAVASGRPDLVGGVPDGPDVVGLEPRCLDALRVPWRKSGSSSGGSTSGIISALSLMLPKFCGPSGSRSISSTERTTRLSPDERRLGDRPVERTIGALGVVVPDQDRSGHDDSIAVLAWPRRHRRRGQTENGGSS